MTWLTYTTLLAIWACTSGQEFDCPGSPGPCQEGEYPYAADCTKFWACTDGCIAYLMDCPATLHFSATHLICLHQVDAMCQVTTTVDPTQPTPESTASTITLPTTTQPTPESTASSTTLPTTTQPTTTISSGPPLDPTIFYVTRVTSRVIRQDPVDYQAIICDRHNDFNADENTFTTPNPGIYFFNLNVGLRPNSGVNYRIEVPGLLGQFANVLRDSEVHSGEDTVSRDLIANLTTDDPFHVTSTAGGYYSDDQQQTSWGGFSLHNSMETVSVFSVGRSSGFSSVGVVDFDTIGVNTNDDFVGSTSSYIAPVAGLYLVSVSAGAVGGTTLNVDIQVNGAVQAQLTRQHTVHDNTDTLSRSMILNLNQGDAVQYYLTSGSLTSDSLLQTSFSGFLVQPRFLTPQAWFVSRSSSWDGGVLEGVLSPVDFDDILINAGGLYDRDTYIVTINSAGFYYIHFGAGAMSEQPVELTLVLNDVNHLANIIRVNGYQTGVDSMSRGYIQAFAAGDQLKIEAESRTSFVGDSVAKLTYFLGIQLYSTE